MTLAYALPKTGHPNCRRPDKVIDAGHQGCVHRPHWLSQRPLPVPRHACYAMPKEQGK